jgi:Fungal N-terminal domain of STAND proteins
MDPFSIAASTAGVLALGGTVISKGYSYVASVRAFPKDLERLLSETAALNQTLTQLVAISYTQQEGQTKKDALHALEESGSINQCKKSLESLDALLATCHKHRGENLKNLKKAALWPLESKDVNKILLSIQKLQQVFQTALAVDNAYALP